MKTSRILTLILGMLALSVGLSAKNFEGKIRLKMTAERGQPMLMNFLQKDGLTRIEIETGQGGSIVTLVDPAKPREMITLMIEQKMYMVIKLPEAKKVEQAAAQAQPEFVRTGETETILGYRCEKIIIKTKDNTTEAWCAEGLGTFMNAGNRGPMGGSAPTSSWEAALAEHGSFPLRSVTRNKSGKEVVRMEAVSIEQQSLAASLFVVPADFKKFEMPSIPGLRGLLPGGENQN